MDENYRKRLERYLRRCVGLTSEDVENFLIACDDVTLPEPTPALVNLVVELLCRSGLPQWWGECPAFSRVPASRIDGATKKAVAACHALHDDYGPVAVRVETSEPGNAAIDGIRTALRELGTVEEALSSSPVGLCILTRSGRARALNAQMREQGEQISFASLNDVLRLAERRAGMSDDYPTYPLFWWS